MAEYIDREAAIKALCFWCAGDVNLDDSKPCSCLGKKEILDTPAADVAEVKHGEWIYSAETINTMSGYFCSACKDPMWHSPDVPQAFRYCPNCGAKMDGKAGAENA